MSIKEKNHGTVQASVCANGKLQWQYTNKEDASSPTVSVEVMMMSYAIDSWERSYVIMTDIPGNFLHEDM